ncbi:MAG: DUF177 domain-containing protein [Lutimonas sp.]|jgi:uncharacterized metal-binding protein YceD (DUF177 family)
MNEVRDPLKEYDISFSGLKPGKHQFIYKIDKEFFELFNYDEILGGKIEVILDFVKKSNLLELIFFTKGELQVACDVSNEPYFENIENDFEIVVKFGPEFNDDDEDLLILPFDEHKLNVAQYIYELIVLALPNKRVHPGVLDGTLKSEIVDKLKELQPKKQKEEIDPRWAELKKLITNKKT